MVSVVQFTFVLILAACPALLVVALARPSAGARRHRGGDPVAFPLRRRSG